MSLIMTEEKSSKINIDESIIKVVIVKKHQALKLIQNFIFDDHVKKLTENYKH